MLNKLNLLMILCGLNFLLSCSIKNERLLIKFNQSEVEEKTFDTYLESKMTELNIAGLAIAIINKGDVTYHKTFGIADKKKGLAVRNKTIFEAASLSKSVFATFVMTFVEEGKLDLDKPLYEYLPYPDIDHDQRYKKITARMVLRHQSGMPNWRENEKDKKLVLKFEPGTAFEYSGEGYQYLAMVLKKINQTDWAGLEQIFQEKIAIPLGMKHTVFIQTPYTRKNRAEPYDKNGDWIDWKNSYWFKKEHNVFVAPSSIHTEALDFSKWIISLIKQDLLKGSSYKEIFEHGSNIGQTKTGANLFYTLGFVTGDKPYDNVFYHSGNNEGFTSWFLVDVEKQWGYVLFTNSAFGEQVGVDLFEYFGGGSLD